VAIYREAYGIMKILDPAGSWAACYRELKAEDIRGPYRDEELDKLSETRHTPSWIWTAPITANRPSTLASVQVSVEDNLTANEHLLSEWARQRARTRRHGEEILLLVEEMRRVLTFLEARSRWWKDQGERRLQAGDPRVLDQPQIGRGLASYSIRQSRILDSLSGAIASDWLPLLRKYRLGNDWIAHFAHLEHCTALHGDFHASEIR
jgi:hypothetical protein